MGVKKFSFINWIAFKSLWLKECNRFMVVWQQTLLSPLVSSLLFLSVLSLALGSNKGDVFGCSFISFLAPGLIAMSIPTQAFSHLNPFFYMIDGFRYGFLGESDGSISVGLIYLILLSFVMRYFAFYLYKKGYKIKS